MPGPYRAALGRVLTCITAVGRHAPMPPKVYVAARSTGCGARSRRPVGRPPYVPLFGLYVGRGDPTPPKFTWPPVQRMAAESAPSVVGGGVPDAPRVSGKRAFTGSHRAGHARPLPHGFWAGAHLYYSRRAACPHAAEVRVAACLTGCRSVPVYGKRAFTGSHRAGHARPLLRGVGRRLTPSPPQFPRPSGSCGPAAAPRCLRAGASPSTPDPAIGRTCTRCASPLPSF